MKKRTGEQRLPKSLERSKKAVKLAGHDGLFGIVPDESRRQKAPKIRYKTARQCDGSQ
jgi:hypothetical protein